MKIEGTPQEIRDYFDVKDNDLKRMINIPSNKAKYRQVAISAVFFIVLIICLIFVELSAAMTTLLFVLGLAVSVWFMASTHVIHGHTFISVIICIVAFSILLVSMGAMNPVEIFGILTDKLP